MGVGGRRICVTQKVGRVGGGGTGRDGGGALAIDANVNSSPQRKGRWPQMAVVCAWALLLLLLPGGHGLDRGPQRALARGHTRPVERERLPHPAAKTRSPDGHFSAVSSPRLERVVRTPHFLPCCHLLAGWVVGLDLSWR